MSLPARLAPFRLAAAAGAALVAAAARRLRPRGQRRQLEHDERRGSAAARPRAPRRAPTCSKDQLQTQTAGKLTIATDKPVYEPWFVDDKPENGKGFEGAVAYAVAEQARLRRGRRRPGRACPFNSVIQPAPKKFDFDINEVSITDKRKQAVDFSSGYYDVTQAIVTHQGQQDRERQDASPTSRTPSSAPRSARRASTRSRTSIKPSSRPAGLQHQRPRRARRWRTARSTASSSTCRPRFYITAGQVKDGPIVGQFANTGGTPEQFGLVLDKGSALTAASRQAVDALRADGTLKQLEQQWLARARARPSCSDARRRCRPEPADGDQATGRRPPSSSERDAYRRARTRRVRSRIAAVSTVVVG